MPRIILKKTEYRLKDLSSYILGEMRAQRITQAEMAAVLNMTQSNLSQKLKACSLSSEDLILIFDRLKTPVEKIGALLKGDQTNAERHDY